ncbi:HD domain-containing protein [Shewanella inventionis]|uniref:HD-GYP domain-containing protein n=1 Tax=Shewanella inventionis TaxID=1738770 RepID=UPI001CBD1D69|nr:HD domain-containing phosphohydrolase [Shewanella inventionis]UAL41542.1 HD domain-containing protein [Shewanella inventionis]
MSESLTAQIIQIEPDDALPLWRHTIFMRLFTTLVIICVPVYITSVYLCIEQGIWYMAIFDTIAYGLMIFVVFYSSITDKTRYMCGCGLAFFIGAGFLIVLGPSGAGFFWLFTFPPLTSVLLGSKAAIAAQLINAVLLIIMGVAFHYQWLHWPVMEHFSTLIWYVVVINFLVTCAIVTQSISYLLGKLTHSLQSTLASRQATVIGLAKLAEYRDNDTGAHLIRMQQYAKMLAKQRLEDEQVPEELTEAFIKEISLSSILHDIGKVGVADHILLKPGKLTPAEFEHIKAHPQMGAKVIDSLLKYAPQCQFLLMGRDIAGGHHEKWDGSGYPKGIKGEAIPLSARIVALVDVYDALTSPRCYKRPFTHQEAKDIILAGRSTHFDPALVDSFISIEHHFAELSQASLSHHSASYESALKTANSV